MFKKERKVEKVERPNQRVGLYESHIWYTDNNEVLVEKFGFNEFLDKYDELGLGYPQLAPFNTQIVKLEPLWETFSRKTYISLSDVIKCLVGLNFKYKDILEFYLYYFNLPGNVEELVISKIKYFKGEIAKVYDGINIKRNRILGR